MRTVFARHAFASCASKLALAVGTVDKPRDKPDNKRPKYIRNGSGKKPKGPKASKTHHHLVYAIAELAFAVRTTPFVVA